eukprot:s642_g18.t1
MDWACSEDLRREKLRRHAGLQAFLSDTACPSMPDGVPCVAREAPFRSRSGQACSFLGLENVGEAAPAPKIGLRSSFAMFKGDFHSELCSDGEAMRIDPDGQPYLVDTEARHDVQLEFALSCAFTIFVGTALVGVVFGMQQAKNRGGSGQEDASPSEAAAKPKAKPKAKSGTEAKAKPKPKAASSWGVEGVPQPRLERGAGMVGLQSGSLTGSRLFGDFAAECGHKRHDFSQPQVLSADQLFQSGAKGGPGRTRPPFKRRLKAPMAFNFPEPPPRQDLLDAPSGCIRDVRGRLEQVDKARHAFLETSFAPPRSKMRKSRLGRLTKEVAWAQSYKRHFDPELVRLADLTMELFQMEV